MSNRFNVTVYGEPIPQGSKSVTKTGRMYEANKKLVPWREKIAEESSEVMSRCGYELITGPCILTVNFFFPRPKAHYRANGTLKPWALLDQKTSKPDLDKLVRAVGDALTGVVVKDDSQFVRIVALKRYAVETRVVISVEEMSI